MSRTSAEEPTIRNNVDDVTLITTLSSSFLTTSFSPVRLASATGVGPLGPFHVTSPSSPFVIGPGPSRVPGSPSLPKAGCLHPFPHPAFSRFSPSHPPGASQASKYGPSFRGLRHLVKVASPPRLGWELPELPNRAEGVGPAGSTRRTSGDAAEADPFPGPVARVSRTLATPRSWRPGRQGGPWAGARRGAAGLSRGATRTGTGAGSAHGRGHVGEEGRHK